jgi:hypothetical protein
VLKESPLRYVPDARRFQGSFLIALEDANAPRIVRDLPMPITIAVTSDADSVTPHELAMDSTNRLARVVVIASEPQDSVRVRIVPGFDMRADVSIWLPVKPTIVLSRLPARLAGLGIQTVNVMVSVHGDSRRDSTRVGLSADHGAFEPPEVVVPRGGHATARLRTDGIGTASISATSPGIDRADATIQYGWPSDFLALALVGGGIGALTSQLSRKRRGKARLVARRVLAGSALGFAAAVVYFGLGVNLLGISIQNQLFNHSAVFGLALLGGMLGIPALAQTGAAKSLLGVTDDETGRKPKGGSS